MAERYGNLTLQLKNLSNLSNIGSTYTNVLLNASGAQKLNAIGSGSFTIPRNATLISALESNIGQVAYVYASDAVVGTDMDIATFIIEKIQQRITQSGVVVDVSGPSIEEQLTYTNLADDTIDDGAGGRDTSSIASIMGYAASGWSHNGTETVKGTYHVSRGDTVFKTLVDAAKQSGEFFRLSSYSAPAKQINWYQSADSSGVTLRMPDDPTTYDGNTTTGIILNLSLSQDFQPTITGVRPYGSGLEDGRLDITDIDSGDTGADPTGYTTTFASNTIVNNTLETSLGYQKREDVDFSHIKVEDPTNPAHLTVAAVSLWDEAIYYLQQRDNTRKFYDIECVVPYDLRAGQTVTVVYSEYEGGTSGGTQIININGAFKVHNVTNVFDTRGYRVTRLLVSDDLVTRPEAVHYIRAVMEKTQATTRKSNVATSPGSVPSTRELLATQPLRIAGGGSADLSANRTFTINGLSTVGTANQIPGTNSGGTSWEYKTLTNGTGINISHGAGTITITNTGTTTDLTTVPFVTIGNTGSLSNERALTNGDGLDLADGGANSNVTLSVDVTDFVGNGLVESSNDIDLGTPSTLTASTSNGVTASSHTHEVTTSSTGTVSTIAAFDSNGRLQAEDFILPDGGWIGGGAAKGRIVYDDAAIDNFTVVDADLIMNTGSSDVLTIRHDGDTENTGADIEAAAQMGIAATTNLINIIDAENASSARYWGLYHDDNTRTGASEIMRITEGGLMLIGDTANSEMSRGITIRQGGFDNEIAAYKSTDVAHGITGETETDTYGNIKKRDAASGGFALNGFTETTVAMQLTGNATNDATGKSAGSIGAVTLIGKKKSGTSVGAMGSGANVCVVRNNTNTLAIFAEDGDLYLDTVVNENHWDDYDDMKLLNGLRAAMVPDGHYLRERFGQFIKSSKDILERTGVAVFNDDGHHFFATKGLQMLTIDALRQKHENDQQIIKALENRIAALEAAI